MYKTIALLLFLAACACSQERPPQLYKIPFASGENSVELAVVNTKGMILKDVKVSLSYFPEWVKFSSAEVIIGELKAEEEKQALFTFSVDKSSPVEKEAIIEFSVTSKDGKEQWRKQIRISVTAPESFDLYQNYPNPFNPSTVISYQLSRESSVTLKIFNVIGEEVSTLFDGIQEAGYYTKTWNGLQFSSGMYICQLIAKSKDGQKYILRKKMSLIK